MSVEPPKGPDDETATGGNDASKAEPATTPEAEVLSLRVPEPSGPRPMAGDPSDVGQATLEAADAYDVESLPRGTQLGRFVLLGRLSEDGDESVIYGAYDPSTDSKISLKLFNPGGETEQSQQLRLSLVAQAQAVATLDHPCIERIYEAGVFGPWVFLATEFIDGIDLQQWMEVRDDPFPWPEVLRVFREAGRGLAAVHQRGIAHRDFRPGTVLMSEGRIVVTSFGFAPEITEQEGDIDISELRVSLHGTGSGSAETEPVPTSAAGTPAYMAPEQHITGQADARSDQFSFCVALYEALYGERPFVGSRPRAIAREAAQHRVRAAPEGSDVPPWLRAVVIRGLSPRPSDRFTSMEHLLRELGRDPSARRRRWAWGAAAALTVVALGAVVAYSLQADQQACEEAGGAMSDVWTSERRQALAEDFAATGRPWADTTWSYTENKLDTWSSRWRNYSRLACMSTRVWGDAAERTYALRAACLDRKLIEFESTIDTLAHIDGSQLDHAHELALHLPEPRICVDTATLMTVGVPSEEDEEQVNALYGELSALDARVWLGDHAGVQQDIPAVLDRVRATEDDALLARADFVAARAQLDDPANAAVALHDAAQAALRVGDQGLVAQIWQTRVEALLHAERFDEALTLSDYTEALLRHKRFGWSMTELQTDQGHAEYGRGRPAAALGRYHAAVQREEDRDDVDALRLVSAWVGRARVLHDRGKAEEALAPLQLALNATRDTLGPTHPISVDVLRELGAVHRTRGADKEARAAFDAALEILRQLDAPPPSVQAALALAIGIIDAGAGESANALTYLKQAHAVSTDPVTRLRAGVALADVYLELDRTTDAQALLQSLVDAPEVMGPRAAPDVLDDYSRATLALASLKWQADDRSGARQHVLDLRTQYGAAPERQALRDTADTWLDDHPLP